MSTLIIDNKTLRLSQQGESIKIVSDVSGPKTIPFTHIKRVVISCNVNIESRVLRTLASKDISVAFINPRKPREYGLLQGSGHNDAARKIRQLKASQNISTCRQISRYLVIEKITAQQQVLKLATPNKAQCQYTINRNIPVLENALKKLQENENLQLNSIRGLEGSAAAAYFNAYKCLFPELLKFTHRNRRPPKDPVNALLSLSYTLADSIACQRLQIVGLDLMIGFYHQLSWSRHSLSSDVIEPVRPQIDEWVRLLIARQHIRIHHFEQNDNACLLKKQGRQIYYALWEQEIKTSITKRIDDCIQHIDIAMGQENG